MAKVLLVTGSFPPERCGVGDYTARLARSLACCDDVDVTVLTSRGDGGTTSEHDRVLRVMESWHLSEAHRFMQILRERQPDIVHLQYPTQGYAGGGLPWLIPLIARGMGKRVAQTWHEPYSRRQAPRLLVKALAGGAIVSVRPDYRQRLASGLSWALWGKIYRQIRSASTVSPCTLPAAELAQRRTEYLHGRSRLIVFFGFVYRHKHVELLFEIADPATDHIVIAGEQPDEGYQRELAGRAACAPWAGQVDFTGFLDETEISALLAAADAVVLPFRYGGGEWNTSLLAAVQEGTFVLTTSETRSGYDEAENAYYAVPEDVQEMRAALAAHAGRRRDTAGGIDPWTQIAAEHAELYREMLA